MPDPRVYLVDDDAVLLASTAELMRREGLDVAAYDSPVGFLEAASPAMKGCIVSDVSMPIMDGVTLVQTLARRGVANPVTLMTGHASVKLAVGALKAGAADFLVKPVARADLIERVRAALAQDRQRRDVHSRTETFRTALAGLTSRERDVLQEVVEGLPNKLIAYRLQISIKTVEVHRARLQDRLGVRSTVELVRLFTRATA